jgi:hypothetical protein
MKLVITKIDTEFPITKKFERRSSFADDRLHPGISLIFECVASLAVFGESAESDGNLHEIDKMLHSSQKIKLFSGLLCFRVMKVMTASPSLSRTGDAIPVS